jgi:hypothetical protein
MPVPGTAVSEAPEEHSVHGSTHSQTQATAKSAAGSSQLLSRRYPDRIRSQRGGVVINSVPNQSG